MRSSAHALNAHSSWFNEKVLLGLTPTSYVRSLLTPFNLVTAAILAYRRILVATTRLPCGY